MTTELERRRDAALSALIKSIGTDASAGSTDLFVEHHLSELPSSYWKQHLGLDRPDSKAVVRLLTLRSTWGHDDLEYFDFTLPDEVTDYVLSVRFDEAGIVDEISMES